MTIVEEGKFDDGEVIELDSSRSNKVEKFKIDERTSRENSL
mgnify:CR=1 FL=1